MRYRNFFSPLLKLPHHHHSTKNLRTATRVSYSIPGKNGAKTFLDSEAHKQTVKEKYGFYNNKSNKLGYHVFPMGMMLLAFLVYWGLVHGYGLTDNFLYEYLTKDIGDKLPPHQMELWKQKLEEEGEEENDTPEERNQ